MIDSIFNNQIDLTFAFIGAIIGYLLPFLIQSIKWLIYKLTKDQIEGIWFNHFFSSDGNSILFKVEKMTISKGFSEKYSVRSAFIDNQNARYSGRLIFEKDFLIFEMRAKKHQENAYSRFPTPPIFTDSTVLIGLSLAQDFGGIATSASNLLSRDQLDEIEVLEQMTDRVKINQKHRILKVLK